MRSLPVAAFVAVIAAAAPASGDPADDAQALAAKGDFIGAATKYREAFTANPRPDLMCNVGVAYYKAKDLPRAHRYLDQCLTIGLSLDAAFITNVRKVLAAVEQKLTTADFKALNLIVQPPAATTTIDGNVHDEAIVGSRRIWLPFGTYKVTVHAEGFTDLAFDFEARDRAAVDKSVTLVPAPKQTEPPSRSEVPPDPMPTKVSGDVIAAAAAATAPTAPPPAQPSRSLVAPIVASAATGALGGIAIGFYLSARSNAVGAESATDSRAHGALEDTAYSRQRIAQVVGGVAVVGAVVAGVLWYRQTRKPARVEVGASASASSASLGISYTW